MRRTDKLPNAISTGGGTKVRQPINEIAQSGSICSTYFDVTDLVDFLTRSPMATGIQRVHAETIRVQKSDVAAVGYVYLDSNCQWRTVNDEAVWRLVEKAVLPNPSWEAERAVFWEQMGEGAPVKFTADDVLYLLGASWTIPGVFESLYGLGHNGPRCVFYIHDVIPLRRPEFHVPELETIFSYWAYNVAFLADAVICNSDSTKRDFIAATGYKHPATVANLNIAPNFLLFDTCSIEQEVLREHNLTDQDYVMMVGTIEPRKNHIAVANVWNELHRRFGDACPKLIIVGRVGWHAAGICQHIDAMNRSGKIVHLEGLSDTHLAVLYKNCFFTVYLSRYEGWGLPVTESLAFGKVCVSADNSSLREAGQNLTMLVDDRSERDIENLLGQLIADPKIVREQELKIGSQVNMKTWQDFNLEIGRIEAELSHKRELETHCVTPDTTYWFGRSHQSNAFSGNMPGEMFRAGTGWHSPEDWGSWSRTSKAGLKFCVSEPGDFEVYLLINVPTDGATLTLSYANRILWKGEVLGQKLLNGQLGSIATGELVQLNVETDKMGEDQIVRSSDHKRTLGVGWIAMRLQKQFDDTTDTPNTYSTLEILGEFLVPDVDFNNG